MIFRKLLIVCWCTVVAAAAMSAERPLRVLTTIKPLQLVVLAVTSRERSPLAPDVPTLYELGYKGVVLDSWYGVFGPKGMPADAIKVLNDHLNVILKMPDVVERMAGQGSTVVGGSPEVLARTNRTDVELVGNIIKELNIK